VAIENILKWRGRVTLCNGYGPTEASVFAVTNSRINEQDPSNIGRVHAGLRSWVVDPSNHDYLSPIGCIGELLLEGSARTFIFHLSSHLQSELKHACCSGYSFLMK